MRQVGETTTKTHWKDSGTSWKDNCTASCFSKSHSLCARLSCTPFSRFILLEQKVAPSGHVCIFVHVWWSRLWLRWSLPYLRLQACSERHRVRCGKRCGEPTMNAKCIYLAPIGPYPDSTDPILTPKDHCYNTISYCTEGCCPGEQL